MKIGGVFHHFSKLKEVFCTMIKVKRNFVYFNF